MPVARLACSSVWIVWRDRPSKRRRTTRARPAGRRTCRTARSASGRRPRDWPQASSDDCRTSNGSCANSASKSSNVGVIMAPYSSTILTPRRRSSSSIARLRFPQQRTRTGLWVRKCSRIPRHGCGKRSAVRISEYGTVNCVLRLSSKTPAVPNEAIFALNCDQAPFPFGSSPSTRST